MRPDNKFTTEQQRFFYPVNNEVEHHESVDISKLPAVLYIGGRCHFVIIEVGGIQEAHNPYLNHASVPEGSVIKQVAGPADRIGNRQLPDILEGEELENIDRSVNSYEPGENEMVVVRANSDRLWMNRGTNLPEDGFLILPVGTPLPKADELGMKAGTEATYEFVGFINSQDKLVIPNYLSPSPMRNVVDWCVANAMAQNGLEHALLRGAQPQNASLLGLILMEPKISAYLRYFDKKHDTTFLPATNPKDESDRFPELTEEERERYFLLRDAAHRFLKEPRH